MIADIFLDHNESWENFILQPSKIVISFFSNPNHGYRITQRWNINEICKFIQALKHSLSLLLDLIEILVVIAMRELKVKNT